MTLVAQMLDLPRIVRVLIAGVVALAVTLLLTPLVDNLYLSRFYHPDTVMLPALVSTGLGIVMYVIGWGVLIGFSGVRPRPTRALIVYVLFGVFVVLFALSLFVFGMSRN